jgi:hypothetical protein
MPSAAVTDVLAICSENLGASATVDLAARAGARAVDACELNTAAIASVPYDQWRGLGASHLWQFVWFELASARPQLFPGHRPAQDTASELALRYELGRGDTLTTLSLTSTEEAQLSEARAALVGWTGLEGLQRREPLVVGIRCRALFHAMAGAQALHAPDLREYVLVHDETVTFCRQCASEVSDLSLVLLHEELHVALAHGGGRHAKDGWALLAHAAEEALVTCLELAGEWWCWTHERPARDDLMERAKYHSYRKAARGLLRALPADGDALVPALSSLAVAVAADGTDHGTVVALNAVCGTRRSRAAWLRVLSLA